MELGEKQCGGCSSSKVGDVWLLLFSIVYKNIALS